ncbi:hypothetical protein [Rathayibacter rathayi]|uniref:hypothetical protein n=1 Tax=Rathayibacter rathayi TaxID=33887 RepID=UPI000CE83881|nr:hypothetical protein [Rathayibacter rathayi]PPF51874.1 hypothetical protein C5C08_00515 [Rathayibacter rathayi]
METSYGQVKKTLQVGAGVGAVSLLAGAVFVPLLILAVVAVIASAIVAAVLSGRPPHRWAGTWVAGVASVVWVFSAIYAVDIWGQAFDLSDAGQPVPVSLSIAMTAAFAASVAGFLTVAASAVISLLRARRHDLDSGLRFTIVPAGV